MGWKRNRKLAADFPDLQYLPKARCGWDCTLACLTYGVRRDILGGSPDLSAWAARHGVAASARYQELGPDARVLWHGTSRSRADKIAEHGLFHKGGLWTTLNPLIAHGFCRSRSERFGTEGAVVCLVLERSALEPGRDFSVEGKGDIFRFHHGLPPERIEYVLVSDEIRFIGQRGAAGPKPWHRGAFAKREGQWEPAQRPPVRFSDAASYSSLEEFVALCLGRLLGEFGEITALELFSCLYACVDPWDALPHERVFEVLESHCRPRHRRGPWQTYATRAEEGVE